MLIKDNKDKIKLNYVKEIVNNHIIPLRYTSFDDVNEHVF